MEKGKTMESVEDYVDIVNAPWGKMFYDLLFSQLNIPHVPKLNILDFGSGLGVTANHFAKWHDVTAVEPNDEMIMHRCNQNEYKQVPGGIEKLSAFENESFDLILCHNVLEYIEDKEPIISELLRVLKFGSILSIVKHNRVGRVSHTAVFKNDPKKALSLIDSKANDENNYLGTQYIYSNDYLEALANKYGCQVEKVLGMRAFYALGQDNATKYDDDWYQNMLELEKSVAAVEEYRNAAFHNHLFIKKSEISI
ncbi:MAG: methyltransferase domain-containing protein [Oscillospiraceae bacterium]|nr:methyltransferase domain-containing protein [Oscillospiraceae bacterium]